LHRVRIERCFDPQHHHGHPGAQRRVERKPLSVDPPDHLKYRRLLDPQFSPKRMAELEGEARKLVNEIIDTFASRIAACDTVWPLVPVAQMAVCPS
jgi:cytochrome P450